MEMFYTVEISLYILSCCLSVVSADVALNRWLSLCQKILFSHVQRGLCLVGQFARSDVDVVLTQTVRMPLLVPEEFFPSGFRRTAHN